MGKEAFKNNMHHYDTMEIIAKAYLYNQDYSSQEAVDHILTELKLLRIIPAVYFVNANLSEEKFQVLLSKKELSELLDNCSNIFKK